MLFVLLAAILFSTIILSINNNLLYQSEMISYQMIRLQALKISDFFFSRIEAETVGVLYPFDLLDDIYDGVDSTFVINGVSYDTRIRTNYCDVAGDTLSPDSTYQRVDIRINVNYNNQTLQIGTPASPLSKVFVDLGI